MLLTERVSMTNGKTAMDKDREAFEAWLRHSGSFTDWSKSPGGEIPKGTYLKPLVERTWQAWQAACGYARSTPSQPEAPAVPNRERA